ncbi:hypothetical protein MOSE0_H03664 [Monosporozyma servazzii]
MAAVVLKKRNIRILVTTLLLLGLTFVVLHSTNSTSTFSYPVSSDGDNKKDTTSDQALVDYESVEDPNKVRIGQVAKIADSASGEDSTNKLQEGGYNAEEYYNKLLKDNPLVMFSKSYCPFSAGLKDLLAEYFDFTPPVVIVELDKDPNGRELQEHIAQQTGRKTVPNLIVNGVSRGGFDDLNELFKNTGLFDSLHSWSEGKYNVTKKKETSNDDANAPAGTVPAPVDAAAAPVVAGPAV